MDTRIILYCLNGFPGNDTMMKQIICSTVIRKGDVFMEFLDKLSLAGLVPVIAVNDADDAVPLCRALAEGGLPVAEITFRTAAAEESIRRVHEALPHVLLCAGTVLTTDQVDRAVKAGASAIVSPGLNPSVVRYCLDQGIPVCPGTANPSDIEMALSLGLKAVKVFPAEAIGGIKLIKSMSAPYGDMKFMPTGGINENNMLDYLSFDKILCCGGSWMVPKDAVEAKDWARITSLTRSAIDKMLGLELRHIGINSADPGRAMSTAKQLSALLNWEIRDGNSSVFCGSGFELMKQPGRGTLGHIAVACNNVARTKWHLENRGFIFEDESTASFRNGKMNAIYLKDEIGGFAFHLVQK